MSVGQGVLYFAAAVVLSAAGVAGLRRLAPRLHLIDIPNDRSLHSQPTPRGAGVVIAMLGVAVSVWIGLFAPQSLWLVLGGYALGAVLISSFSLTDDIRSISIGVRLTVQIVAAVTVTLAVVERQPGFEGLGVRGWLLVALSVVWVVSFINTYNFMDGIDGLAGTQGLIGGLTWSLLATIDGKMWLTTLSLVIAGGSLGFLFSNWSPARIFLGDVGSAFLGYTFAFLVLVTPKNAAQLIGGVLIVWPMLFDEAVTMGRRLLRHENLFVAHRSHLYQRMALSGIAPSRVASIYGFFATLSAVAGVTLWIGVAGWIQATALLLLIAFSLGLWRFVATREPVAIGVALTSEVKA